MTCAASRRTTTHSCSSHRTDSLAWLLSVLLVCSWSLPDAQAQVPEWQLKAAKILANQSVGHDGIGAALSLWQDEDEDAWLALGAPHHAVTDVTGAGAAYVFHINAADLSWTEMATLTAPTVAAQGLFGTSLSRSAPNLGGGILAIGSPGESNNGGRVYLYQPNMVNAPDAWTLQQTLASSNTPEAAAGALFGQTVEWVEDTLWIGSPMEGLTVENQPSAAVIKTGLVHIYQSSSTAGGGSPLVSLVEVLDPPVQQVIRFGHAIASGRHNDDLYVAVGAPQDAGPSELEKSGSVYLYRKLVNEVGFFFELVTQLHAPEAGAQDLLGSTVAIQSPLVVAGAVGHNAGQGAVHTWQWTTTSTPVHVADALLVGNGPNDGLGQSVLLQPNANSNQGGSVDLWVGALLGDGHTEDEGTVQQASWTGATWTSIITNTTRLLEPVGSRGTVEFGATLGSAGPWLAVGATHDSGNGAFRSGLAYVFLRSSERTPTATSTPTATPLSQPNLPTPAPAASEPVPTRIPTPWVPYTPSPAGPTTTPPVVVTNPPVAVTSPPIVVTNPPAPPQSFTTPETTNARSGAGRFGYALFGMALAVGAFLGGRFVGRAQGLQEPGPNEVTQSALSFGSQQEEAVITAAAAASSTNNNRRLELGQHDSSESSSVDMTEDGKYEI